MPEIYDVDEQNEGVETQNDDKNGDSKTTTTMTTALPKIINISAHMKSVNPDIMKLPFFSVKSNFGFV